MSNATIQLLLTLLICMTTVATIIYLFHRADERRRQQELQNRFLSDIMPSRMQAYERMALYLERISPVNSVPREQMNVNTALELHTLLISSIRQEFEHNVAMQVYMTSASWRRILQAKDEVCKLLTEVAKTTDPKASSIELGRKILEEAGDKTTFYIRRAQEGLRSDLAGEFVRV